MKTTLVLPYTLNKAKNAGLQRMQIVKKKRISAIHALNSIELAPKNTRKPYFKFYQVFKNETSVTEVSKNDFKTYAPTLLLIKTACAAHSKERPALFMPKDRFMFYGFLSRIRAMEFAKAGALKYISKLIDEGERGFGLLLKYRETHYEDLNINLTDRNIKRLEWELEPVG